MDAKSLILELVEHSNQDIDGLCMRLSQQIENASKETDFYSLDPQIINKIFDYSNDISLVSAKEIIHTLAIKYKDPLLSLVGKLKVNINSTKDVLDIIETLRVYPLFDRIYCVISEEQNEEIIEVNWERQYHEAIKTIKDLELSLAGLIDQSNNRQEIVRKLIKNCGIGVFNTITKHKINLKDNFEEMLTYLHIAAEHNPNPSIIKALISHGLKPNCLTMERRTPLHYAAMKQRSDIISALLESGADPNATDNDGNTPLHIAAKSNPNLDTLRILMQKSESINQKNEKGEMQIHLAAGFNENHLIVKELIEAGADLESTLDTPLHYAAKYGSNLNSLKLLIDAGCNVNHIGKNLVRPIHYAAANSKMPCAFQALLDVCDKELLLSSDLDDNNLLHYAAKGSNNPDQIHFLVSKGLNILSKNKFNETPLMIAAKFNPNSEVMKAFVEEAKRVTKKIDTSVLEAALKLNPNFEVAKALVQSKCIEIDLDDAYSNAAKNPNSDMLGYVFTLGKLDKDLLGIYGFNQCVSNSNLDVANMLLSAGAKVTITEDLMCDAARDNGNPGIIDILIKLGANPNKVDNIKRSPLHWAVMMNRNPEMTKKLISVGANVNAVTPDKKNALHLALKFNQSIEVIKALIDARVDIEKKDSKGRTPIFFANFSRLDVLKLLVERGAKYKQKNWKKRTLLHKAVKKGTNWEVIEYLVDIGIDIDAVDQNKDTALHIAFLKPTNQDVIQALISSNANTTIRNKDKKTAEEISMQAFR